MTPEAIHLGQIVRVRSDVEDRFAGQNGIVVMLRCCMTSGPNNAVKPTALVKFGPYETDEFYLEALES